MHLQTGLLNFLQLFTSLKHKIFSTVDLTKAFKKYVYGVHRYSIENHTSRDKTAIDVTVIEMISVGLTQ